MKTFTISTVKVTMAPRYCEYDEAGSAGALAGSTAGGREHRENGAIGEKLHF